MGAIEQRMGTFKEIIFSLKAETIDAHVQVKKWIISEWQG
jgi:hypothetical protein